MDYMRSQLVFTSLRTTQDSKLLVHPKYAKLPNCTQYQKNWFEAKMKSVHVNCFYMDLTVVRKGSRMPVSNYLIPLLGDMWLWSLIASLSHPVFF